VSENEVHPRKTAGSPQGSEGDGERISPNPNIIYDHMSGAVAF